MKEGGPPTGRSRRPLAGSYGPMQIGRPFGSTVQPPCGIGPPPPSGCQPDPISQYANSAASKIAAFIIRFSSVGARRAEVLASVSPIRIVDMNYSQEPSC